MHFHNFIKTTKTDAFSQFHEQSNMPQQTYITMHNFKTTS